MSKSSECVKVIVRWRPFVKTEKQKKCKSIIEVDQQISQISIKKSDNSYKTFRYDAVATMESSQVDVYTNSAFSMIESAIQGYNATIFAYGQTGWGKTHTMIGEMDDENLKGIMPRSFEHIFSVINSNEKPDDRKYLVRWSFIEIYNEDIHDLLSKDPRKKKEIKEDPNMGVFVKGATMSIAKTLADIKKALALGSKNRKKGETLMNKDSSRSHCMFTVYVETQESIAKSDKIKVGKLNLVDLAGSERQKKSGAANQRLKEASNINLSLTSLMNVISALVNSKKTHIPYRDSKLTRLLEDSLGGNTKTCMIANISPADYNFEETMSTLRYANRAKNIKNRPKINQDPKDTLLKEYLEEIKRLKTMLDDMKDGKEVKISIPSMKAASRPSTRNGDLDDLELSKSELLSEDENGRRYSILSDEEYKNSEEYQQVLQKKEEELNQEKNQKQELENALKELEEKLAQSNNVEKEEMVKMQQYREIQLKLEEEKAIQDKLLKEKLQKEEEMILVERDYQTLQEEVDEQRKLIRVLRNKYKDAVEEIKDLSAEANNEREYLGTALMEMQKEMSLYKSILHGAFSHDEIDRIVARSNYNPDNKVWKVPSFMFRANKLNLFNKNHDRLQDMQSQERNNHTLHFTRDKRNDSEDLTGNGALPPPAPQTPNGTRFTSKWNQNKIGRKTLADFSNERNVANRSEYYIGMEKEVKPKLKIVKKLTNSGSKVKLAPLKVGQELTDSSLESNPNITNIKSTTNMMEGKKKKIVAAAKPIDVGPGVLEDSGELKAEVKVSQGKSKVKTKTNLFSRGKGSKKTKGQRIGKLVSYIELY